MVWYHDDINDNYCALGSISIDVNPTCDVGVFLTTIIQPKSVLSTMPVLLTNFRIGSDICYAEDVWFYHYVWSFDGSRYTYYVLHAEHVWYVPFGNDGSYILDVFSDYSTG